MGKNLRIFAGLFLTAVAGGLVALILWKSFEKDHVVYYPRADNLPLRPVAMYGPAMPGNLPDFETAASMSVHAVVHIKSEFQKKSLVYDDFFPFFNFFGNPTPREYVTPYTAMGSGVIITSEGYIVTNNHVVQDATNITVTLNDKRVYKAKIVGNDPGTDLALIKIEENNLPFLNFGNSDDVRVGEWVLAVGNPFNLTSTVTAGIVSAKARDINILGSQGAVESFIQTDAAINPGNSGGALVNTRGELIGINAAIASGTGYYTGYSFAIPVNIVKKVVEDYIKFGKIQRAYLGIYYKEIDDQFAKDKDLHDLRGVYVSDVVDGGSAQQAGIKEGDILLKISDKTINGRSELQEAVSQLRPGDKVNVMVSREGKEMEITMTLTGENSASVTRENKLAILGAMFEPLTEKEKAKFRLETGFKITQLSAGKLRDAGIREGFILLNIDREPVYSLKDLREALSSKEGGILIDGLYPNGMRAYFGIGL